MFVLGEEGVDRGLGGCIKRPGLVSGQHPSHGWRGSGKIVEGCLWSFFLTLLAPGQPWS